MVFDLGYTEQAFPLFRVVIGGALLWLGMNLVVIVEPPTDN